MLYRETGQFKTSYAADMAIFPIRQDRIALWALLALAFIGVPLLAHFQIWPLGSDYMLRAVQSDPQDSELWKLKLKLDLKAGRYEQCYRDIAALDRLQARPPSFIHLEELLPPIGMRRRGAD